jgi:DNA-binding transcriptional LysR family regulator
MIHWKFGRGGETVTIEPNGRLLVQVGGALDLAIDSAVQGSGVISLVEDRLKPYVERAELEPVLQPWWPQFSGPCLYCSGRRLVPAPLRAFIDFIRNDAI